MYTGVFFLIEALFYLSLLLVVYFKKEVFESKENKVYSKLIVITFVELLTEILLDFVGPLYLKIPAISYFVAKVYCLLIIMWNCFLCVYVFLVALKLKNKEKYSDLSKSLLILGGVLLSIMSFSFSLEFFYSDNVAYTYGAGVNVVYVSAIIYSLIGSFCLIWNFKEWKDKRFMPVIILVTLGSLCSYIQYKNPGLLLATAVHSFITFLMYFTIENPDAKMIKEIHNAKVISDNANYEKTMFLYDMTNEIRGITKEINTETNDILTETKNEEVNIENINESARNIKSSTGKFTALTNEILDIDRIDSASIKVYNEKYSIKLILKELVSTYKKKCNGKGIDFRTSIVSDLPEYLYGDAIGFKNVLISLLDNSIKYTNKGYIELNVNMIKKQDICRLIITIEDSGVGIKSNDLEKIFKKDTEYFNYNRSNLKNNLYNAKKLITLMGGTIIATSTYGKGTNMKIVLDQKEVIMEKNDYTKVYDKKKILLVDEGEYTEKILRKYLHNTGVEIDSVKLGKNCLDKIRDKERYDLILIDENISPISSIELMHKLKEVRNFNIPCILLTRNYGIEYSCYYVDQGFSDYLFKPIDKNALLNKINKF